ncbi:MAG: peptide/nickel transport system permease protein [Solirubrobacteraceae bacterium]|nr:peptide/nickel transport system permease protein [Solirubrobacteraceae bacterium]
MAPNPSSEFAFEPSPSVPGVAATEGRPIEAVGPWSSARARLRRNRTAMTALAVFATIVACCLAAPLWADQVAHVGPDENNLTGTFERGGKRLYVVTPPPETKPVGPGWSGRYLLGADKNGRDEMVRLLYGGRNSLLVGFASALITTVVAVILGLLAGYFRGRTDLVVRTTFDIIWSFPVLLLGISLGTALAIGGLHLGPIDIESGSLWIPILVIGVIYIPYLGRPVRGQVLALREKEFVEAAVAQGAGPLRIMFGELLPNLASTILVFGTLIVANNILTEAALSFLGAGVQLPTPSWGNMIGEGVNLLSTAPHLTIVPGLAITLTVLALNVFGDGLRDALDPRAKVRLR